MEKKITKRDNFELIKSLLADNKQIVDFCNHELELLDKKSIHKTNKPTKAQIANEGLKETILALIADNAETKLSIGTITKMLADESISTQKVSALVKQLKDAELVTRYTEGKNIYFKVNA